MIYRIMNTLDDTLFPMMLFKTASAWRNELDRRLKPLGLSQAKWRTLMHIARADEPLSQQLLAKKMGIEGATLVGLLDRLGKDGWIVRKLAPNDRRVKHIALTNKSKKIITTIRKSSDELKQETLSHISPEDYQTCIKTLEKIKEQLEKNH